MNEPEEQEFRADPLLIEPPVLRDYYNYKGKAPELTKEQPHHRRICVLAARGFKPAEIADMVGMSTSHISTILRQPWARVTMAELQGTVGEQVVRESLKAHSPRAVEILRQAMEGELTQTIEGATVPVSAKAADRINAAKEILTRAYPQLNQNKEVRDAKDLTDAQLADIIAGN